MRFAFALPVLFVLVAAHGSPGSAAEPAPAETAYDAAVAQWYEAWSARPGASSVERGICMTYWQTGDEIRKRMKAADIPGTRTSYHKALLAYVDAALAAADECLAEGRITGAWIAKTRQAHAMRRALVQTARAVDRHLPTNWN